MTDKIAGTRRRIFVDKKFQTRFILNYVLLILIGTLLFNVAAYIILDRQLGASLFSAHQAIKRTGELLLPTLFYLSATFIFILGLATIFITLILSHRISGPLFAIVRYLRMLAEGNMTFEAKLRTKDQTAALADSLSETTKVLKGRIIMLKETTESQKKDLTKLAAISAEKPGAQNDLIKTVHDLGEHVRTMEDRLAFFETE
jgi:methyl-accepting chemotaxis protein